MSVAAVAVDRLCFTYPGREQPALVDVSFDLPPGSWTLVAGATGSGKSTLLRALAGLIPHHTSGTMHGTVRLFDENTRDLSPRQLVRHVALVLQSADDQICATTVQAEVAFGPENLALAPDEIDRLVDESLAQVGLADYRQRPTGQLSGGEKQRLVLAALLALGPQILVCDEPLSQLDPQAAVEFLDLLSRLRERGHTIIVAEHRLDEVWAHADHVLVLDRAKLAATAALEQTESMTAALDCGGLKLPETVRLAKGLDVSAAVSPERLAEQICARRKSDGSAATSQALNSVAAEMNHAPIATSDEPLVRCRQLSFQYVKSSRNGSMVLRDVDFEVRRGERIAIVGANGAGKSTLLAILAGLERPSGGDRTGRIADGARVGLMLQNPDLMLFSTDVRSELSFGALEGGQSQQDAEQRAGELAELLGLTIHLDDPPLSLSQGQRLRVAFGAVLACQPQLLLLDEPTTGQDRRQVERIMETVDTLLADAGGIEAAIFSTHDVGLVVRHANRVLVLRNGQLLADTTPHALLASDDLLEIAQLRRTPLFEVRNRLGCRATTVEAMIEELR